jgi:hypothetical protein
MHSFAKKYRHKHTGAQASSNAGKLSTLLLISKKIFAKFGARSHAGEVSRTSGAIG